MSSKRRQVGRIQKNYKAHEYKALSEWLEHTGRTIEWQAKERFAAVGVVK